MSKLKGKWPWITGGGNGPRSGGAQSTGGNRGNCRDVRPPQGGAGAGGGQDPHQRAARRIAALDVFRSEGGQESSDGNSFPRHGRVDILLNSAGLNTTTALEETRRSMAGGRSSASISTDRSYTNPCACCGDACEERRADRQRVLLGRRSSSEIDRLAAYNGSKHAVTAMTETINMEECANGNSRLRDLSCEVATPIHGPAPGFRRVPRIVHACCSPRICGNHHPVHRRTAGPMSASIN